MNRIVIIILISILFQNKVAAQRFTLQQAIDSALANNVQVRQNRLLVELSEVNWKQARANQLPNLNSQMNHGANQGRSIDPFTNTYVNERVQYAGYGLYSEVLLFNGGRLQNSIKQNALSYDASKMELQQAKDNMTLNVILAYMNILNSEDQMASATKQAEISQRQLDRLEILDRQGAISPSQVSDVRGQLMNDQLAIVNLRNQWLQAKLALAQLMNIPYVSTIEVERIDVENNLETYPRTSSDVYRAAVQQMAIVKAVELRKKSAEYALKAAKGDLYPQLFLNSGVETNYSSIAQNAAGKIPYNSQLRNNIFSSVNFGLRIPIFNAKQARNRIHLADLEVQRNDLLEENTRVLLQQQIEQAHLNMTNAYDRYKVLQEQVKAFEESFKAAEARFNVGISNSVEFLIAKNNLDRATINLISAKYEYVIRKNILDYYTGR